MDEPFEAELAELVGPRAKRDLGRVAYRHRAHETRQLTPGGRLVQATKPRARTKANQELELASYTLSGGLAGGQAPTISHSEASNDRGGA